MTGMPSRTLTTNLTRMALGVMLASGASLSIPSLALAQSGAGTDADADYETPRTHWGAPDLQGMWTNDNITPFERPEQLGDWTEFTDEEIEARKQVWRDRLAVATTSTAPRTEPLPVARSSGSYSPLWYGPRDRMVPGNRAALVIDPPDGRIPLRPEAETRRDFLVSHRTDDHLNMSVYSRCLTRGVPGQMFPNLYNNGHQILQTPGLVVIHHEMMRTARIIPVVNLGDTDHVCARIHVRVYRCGWGMHEATGTATRWWSRRPTSTTGGGSPRTPAPVGCTVSR